MKKILLLLLLIPAITFGQLKTDTLKVKVLQAKSLGLITVLDTLKLKDGNKQISAFTETLKSNYNSAYNLSHAHNNLSLLQAIKASDTTRWAQEGADSSVFKTNYQAQQDTNKLHNQIVTKQNQLNGTGFVKVTGTTISYDNSTYLSATGDGSGLIGLTKSQVGLANVDNTSDANKPISTLTQNALNTKIAFTDTTNKIATKHDIRDTVSLTDYVYTKSQLNASGGGGLVHFDNVTNKYVVYKTIASGTAYSLTATDTVLLFGTTRPSDTLKTIGTYRLTARINLKYNGATFAANQTATFKIRRVNNTASDIVGSTTTITLGIVTTLTETVGIINLPLGIYYSTNNINDILQLRGVISALPGAGSVDVVEAEIIAERVN